MRAKLDRYWAKDTPILTRYTPDWWTMEDNGWAGWQTDPRQLRTLRRQAKKAARRARRKIG